MKLIDIWHRASAWNGYLRLEITPLENTELHTHDSAFRNICKSFPTEVSYENAATEWCGFIGRSGLLCVFLKVPCERCGVAFYCACMRAFYERLNAHAN